MYFEELAVGQSAETVRVVTQADIVAFAEVSGDRNAVHLSPEYASKTTFKGVVAHGMLSASFISGVLGTKLPGEGTIYIGQSLRFLAPVRPGDAVVTRVTVKEIRATAKSRGEVICLTTSRVGDVIVIDGEATVLVPKLNREAA
ncbi:MAG TPA: MaoC family dehydratase [Burkholderiales bacterium]|nr:MaoC family dehydratase [Burkholderiales bacterium]